MQQLKRYVWIICLTWAANGFFAFIADEGANPQGSPVGLHLVLPLEVGIELLHRRAHWDRQASVGWARTTNASQGASPPVERFHGRCIKAAPLPKTQLVGFLVEEVWTLVLKSAFLSNITGTICSSCQCAEQQNDEKQPSDHLWSLCLLDIWPRTRPIEPVQPVSQVAISNSSDKRTERGFPTFRKDQNCVALSSLQQP